jgi:hypothetical protein
MEKLFEKDPYKRMEFIPLLKEHPWFFNLDWNMLINKEVLAPFVPYINNESDVSNFDT